MRKLFLMLKTLQKLGILNVVLVIVYRYSLKFSIHPVQRLTASLSQGCFFLEENKSLKNEKIEISDFAIYLFGNRKFSLLGPPPLWHYNILSSTDVDNTHCDWWKISDFGDVGDIKGVWEISRFSWLPLMAQEYKRGNAFFLHQINNWINDWIVNNPPYKGNNWKCAQEAAIRTINVSLAFLIIGPQYSSRDQIINFVNVHLKRIKPTLSYARAQNNNHALSESIALYIGGAMLEELGDTRGKKYVELGYDHVDKNIQRLFLNDGTFCQYSDNYQRLALDLVSIFEIWRRRNGGKSLSSLALSKVSNSIFFLKSFLDSDGSSLNIGANDGAWLLPVPKATFFDYRPSVQLASVLFQGHYIYDPADDQINYHVNLFDIAPLPTQPLIGQSVRSVAADNEPPFKKFLDGGYVVSSDERKKLICKLPKFKYRPSQNDILNLAFSLNGMNIFLDCGTYSYYEPSSVQAFYSGAYGHNTVVFDRRNQMVQLSRFLYADWPTNDTSIEFFETNSSVGFKSKYVDFKNCTHGRMVELGDDFLEVTDTISGDFEVAEVVWHLGSPDIEIGDKSVALDNCSISIEAVGMAGAFSVSPSGYSRFYGSSIDLPTIKFQIQCPGTVKTRASWT